MHNKVLNNINWTNKPTYNKQASSSQEPRNM